MATKQSKIIENILQKPSDAEFIERMIETQEEEFPSVSDITIIEPFVDPLAFPSWCNQTDYAFAWVDLRDDIQRHNTIEAGYYKIVNRSSSCIKGGTKPLERDFRDHGAVERLGLFLVFRPRDIDAYIRGKAVQIHADMVKGIEAPKKEEHFEVSGLIRGEKDTKIDIVAYEEAGKEGLKFAE